MLGSAGSAGSGGSFGGSPSRTTSSMTSARRESARRSCSSGVPTLCSDMSCMIRRDPLRPRAIGDRRYGVAYLPGGAQETASDHERHEQVAVAVVVEEHRELIAVVALHGPRAPPLADDAGADRER